MTLNEIADVAGLDTDEEALGFLMVAFQIIRSALQREPATFEGCCASSLKWVKIYGRPTPNSIRTWLADIPKLAAFDIPDAFVEKMLAVDD